MDHGDRTWTMETAHGPWRPHMDHGALYLHLLLASGFPRPGFKNFTFVAIAKTWAESRSYCRQHHTDLAMIQDQSENSAVLAISSTYQVWVGLYREPWRWSDGSTSSFTNWMNVQPGNSRGIEHCVLENIYHQWNDGVCSQTYPFFCQREFTHAEKRNGKVLLVNMKVQSGTDLSQPEVWTQMLQKIKETLLQSGLSDLRVQWNNAPKAV
uniref:C-type lectin domain-containing protein n=1 Tax=Knipowitschia caucasica TaxID=637954 RepID=A0AAV2LVT7_KNICA